MNRYSLAVASVSLLTPSLTAAFEGPYAPELWTFTTEAGGFIDQHTPDTLILVGGDSFLSGDTTVLVTATASGTWSFDWHTYSPPYTVGADNAYYLINGVATFIPMLDGSEAEGMVSVTIEIGDIIGFRVDTVDGVFGPGVLTITNFTAPVPGPGAIAVVLPLMMAARRRRASLEPRSSP